MIDGLIKLTRKELLEHNCKNFAIIDFEFTCGSDGNEGKLLKSERELISVGLIIVNMQVSKIEEDTKVDFRILRTYQSTIQPVVNKEITPFCTELTGITQESIDKAPSPVIVLNKVRDILQRYGVVRIFSWGSADKYALSNSMYRFYREGLDSSSLVYIHQYIRDLEKDIRKDCSNGFKAALSIKRIFKDAKCSIKLGDDSILSYDNMDDYESHRALIDCYIALGIFKKYLEDLDGLKKDIKNYILEKSKELQLKEN